MVHVQVHTNKQTLENTIEQTAPGERFVYTLFGIRHDTHSSPSFGIGFT